jgi:hypothetical protein
VLSAVPPELFEAWARPEIWPIRKASLVYQERRLARDEIRSVTAEFTPRVRLDHHPNFNRTKLNGLIRRGGGKLLVRVTGLLMFDSTHFLRQNHSRKAGY